MIPPAIPGPDHIEAPPGFEPRTCVRPPADDRMELLRYFVLSLCWDNGLPNAARVLAQRAELGDAEAWEAVGRGVKPDFRHCDTVTDALAKGDLDAALRAAAMVCGDYSETADGWRGPLPEKWLRETREERAAKGGAR